MDKTTELNLVPTDSLWTTAADGAVILRMEDSGPAAEPPITIHHMIQQTVQRFGDFPAMAVKRNSQWHFTTYHQYYHDCRTAAKSFLKLGLERFHCVGILGSNAPEWFIAQVGAILAGGLSVGLYPTYTSDACQYVANNCEINVLVVENHQQLLKIQRIQDQLPHLKAIVQYHDELQTRSPNLYTWKEFMQLGSAIPDSTLDDLIASQKANQCCSIVYTSATTGPPKGVMLSHDNVTWGVKTHLKYMGAREHEVTISYLPLSHVAGQLFEIWYPFCKGGTVYFADSNAMKGSLIETLKEVRPTMFLGVPRIWEKIRESLEYSKTIRKTTLHSENDIGPTENGFICCGSSPLESSLILKRKADVGLDRCVYCQIGSAPVKKDLLDFFLSLDLHLMDAFGMSETLGPCVASAANNFRITSCGKPMPGCKARIHEPNPDGTGEICAWGRNTFMGYLNMEQRTHDVFDDEGWVHSGDLGKFDQDGFLYITGRIKELVITAGGKNVAPIPIENAVKEELAIISNALLVGDHRKFLSMLLTLKCTVDADSGEPQDDLTAEAIKYCQQLGSSATRVSEVISTKDSGICHAIQKGMERVNLKAFSQAEKVQKWTILPKDFSIAGGELGPTLKVRRLIILEKYETVIDELYKV